jgi:hypothetical protein
VLRRILDAIHVLFFGRGPTERRCMLLEQDLLLLFEKMNTLLAREAKRESRKAIARLAELEQEAVTPTASSSGRKAELRTRVFGHLRPSRTREVVEDESSDQNVESQG